MIDPDKLRALHEAAKTAGPGTKRFRTSLLKSELVARADEIISMAEENQRMREALQSIAGASVAFNAHPVGVIETMREWARIAVRPDPRGEG